MSRPYKKPRLAFYPFELGAPWVVHVRKARALNLIREGVAQYLCPTFISLNVLLFALLYLYRFFSGAESVAEVTDDYH